METDFLTVMRFLFAGLFFVTLLVGAYLAKNHNRFFGTDAEVPSENGSSQALGKVQVWSLWAHVLLASGAFALLLH